MRVRALVLASAVLFAGTAPASASPEGQMAAVEVVDPGPRVAESGLGLITGYGFSAPYEDVKLKGK